MLIGLCKVLAIIAALLVALILVYVILGFLISLVPANFKNTFRSENSIRIFVKSDGIHSDFILPAVHDVFNWNSILMSGSYHPPIERDNYVGLGWGDKGFYLDIPEWSDLTFKIAFNAMCRPTPTVMHVTSFDELPKDSKYFRTIDLNQHQYQKLCNYILRYFQLDSQGDVRLIPDASYGESDNFYLANYSYHAIKTCNEWVNHGLKKVGVRTAVWSPGAFGIFVHEKPLKERLLSKLHSNQP